MGCPLQAVGRAMVTKDTATKAVGRVLSVVHATGLLFAFTLAFTCTTTVCQVAPSTHATLPPWLAITTKAAAAPHAPIFDVPWYLGKANQTCDEVCGATNRLCGKRISQDIIFYAYVVG